MDDAQFQQIWTDVQSETNNRSKGSFKRALWYGNNSVVFGQNKGLRKGLRNAPKNVAMMGVGAGLAAVSVPPGVSDLISAAVDVALTKGKDVYSSHVKAMIKGNPPMSVEEGLRKNVKSSVKDLKGNAFQVIDRNLVKLRDAKKKVSPALQQMMQSQSHMSYTTVSSSLEVQTEEKQLQKAHDALRAVAETQYYTNKIAALVSATQDALGTIMTDLNSFKAALQKTEDEVTGYVKEYL